MAAEYFLYCTLYNNTLVCRSNNSFAPLPPNTGEILIDYFIPETQSLYLYRESSGSITINNSTIINEYLEATNPPSADEYITYKIYSGYTGTTKLQLDNIENDIDFLSGKTDNNYVIFTGYTANTNQRLNGVDDDIMYLSGATTDLTSDFNQYVNITAPNQFVNVTGDSMTGTLIITGALSATERISGLTAYGSSCIYSPIICGTSCTISPITIGSTCVCSPVVLGSVSVCSPTVCSSTCLCSTGTARFTGAVTAASTLNVSGNTTLGSQLYLNSMSTGGTLADYTVVWNPTTKQLRSISPQGSSCVYCYTQNTTPASTTSTVNQTYLTATWTLPVGTYSMEFNMLYGNNTSNRCAITCFLLDGAIVGYCNLIKTNDTNVVTTAYVTQDTTFATCTSHTFSIVYRQCGGGSALANYGAIRVQKIGV